MEKEKGDLEWQPHSVSSMSTVNCDSTRSPMSREAIPACPKYVLARVASGACLSACHLQTLHSETTRAAWKKLSRWLKGPDKVMDLDVDPDELEESKKEWALEWQRYREEILEESLDHIKGMGQAELRERGNWLVRFNDFRVAFIRVLTHLPAGKEAEFTRIRENFPALSNDTKDPQVLAGLHFVGEMLDSCQADLVSVMVCILSLSSTEVSSLRMPSPIFKAAARNADSPLTSDSTSPKFQIPIEQLKVVERSHMFALSCMNRIMTLKQVQVLRRRHQAPAVSQQSESNDNSSIPSGLNNVYGADEETANDPRTLPPESIHLDGQNLTRTPPANFVSDDIGPGRLYGRGINQPQQPISSSNSHRKNLTALIGIAFFGASITWSTVFSGARGDLVLISWSACLFIVGAVGAAAASMLVLPDEDIVAKHIEVRWTVRILSLLSMVHVLAGMFLVALAILVLDPAQESLQAPTGRAGMRSAGAYAIAASVLSVVVSGAMWRRYTIQTWFG
ncbi:hypothetical protein B0H14DRAFT_2813848, partial [Mycena olivaceomarginata]